MLDYDIQAHILYVIIPNYTISLCDNNDYIYVALCKALFCCLGAFLVYMFDVKCVLLIYYITKYIVINYFFVSGYQMEQSTSCSSLV